MNLNDMLINGLSVIGYPVEQDLYTGSKNKYITFVYEDERPALSADDEEEITQVYMSINFFAPKEYNYFSDKKKIKKILMQLGFTISSIQTWVRDDMVGTDWIRQTTFNCYYAEKEEE
ncbi:MAG: hypothetical protein MJZ37_08065 [Bacilli bacterium]|nr:hypothetical protein [Bacilli bacterium]